jgi:hypothetical protein
VKPTVGNLPSGSDDAFKKQKQQKVTRPSINTWSKYKITTFLEQPQLVSDTQTHDIKGGLPCDPALASPYRLAEYGNNTLYTLFLLWHGEWEWNHLNRYTGWRDVDLTNKGRQEARDAGRLLAQNSRRPTIARLAHLVIGVLSYSSFDVVVVVVIIVIIIVVANVADVGGSVGLLLLLLFVSS